MRAMSLVATGSHGGPSQALVAPRVVADLFDDARVLLIEAVAL